MSQAVIDRIIERRFNTIRAGGAAAYPNTPFDPNGKPLYLVSHIIPATVQGLDLAGDATIFRGAWQINIVTPKDSGVEAARTEAARIAELLPPDLQLTDAASGVSVYLNGPATVFSGIESDDSYTIPVSVNYRSDIFNPR